MPEGPKRPKRPRDVAGNAVRVMEVWVDSWLAPTASVN